MSGRCLVLVSLTAKKLRVNCSAIVVGSMLFKDLSAALASAPKQ